MVYLYKIEYLFYWIIIVFYLNISIGIKKIHIGCGISKNDIGISKKCNRVCQIMTTNNNIIIIYIII